MSNIYGFFSNTINCIQNGREVEIHESFITIVYCMYITRHILWKYKGFQDSFTGLGNNNNNKYMINIKY